MTAERWKQISQIYEGAVTRDASARVAFLKDACAGDTSLQREVQALLDQPTSPRGLDGLTPSAIARAMGDDAGAGLTGRRFGVYLVHERIGVGGMGEVYRARDTRLGRDVAIKVLPPAFANDADRLARFEREARVLASLDHPHIGTIHGVEEGDPSTSSGQGVKALVLALVEGETLAERIARGPIPMAEALDYARQIADALEAAHEKGIVHRDLKPGNIKITPAGVVKVLDFGLAKALGPSEAGHDATSRVTHEGLILGTAAYMSPEQARGLKVDKRADVWAFGCVLYEMVTKRVAFGGETVSDTIAAILGQDVDWNALPNSTPQSVHRLLHRCLAKDSTHRLRDIGDARLDLEEAGEPVPSVATRRRSSWIGSFGWVPAFGAVLGALAIGSLASALYFRRAPAVAPEMRVEIATPGADGFLTRFALSPDGRTLAFVATEGKGQQIWLRALDAESARPLARTEGASGLFWSPDSHSIAFFANAQLKVIDAAGGPPVVLASAHYGVGGTWSTDGEILFSQDTGPLYRVSARGGEAVAATRVDPPRITAHFHPFFLPDGRHFLFLGWGTPEQKGVYLGSLDSPDTHRLFAANSTAVFAPPDRVLYARQGALVAQRLDMKTWQPIGEPLPVADAVGVDIDCGGCVAASASATGLVAYRTTGPARQLVWIDRSGRQMGTVGAPDTARRPEVQPSPDGRFLAFARQGEYLDLWLLDVTSGVSQRLTFEAANKVSPVWSPDSRRIVYSWDLAGQPDLYVKAVDGAGNGTLLRSSSEPKVANDWSADGQFILYASGSVGAKTNLDLWALPLAGDMKPVEVAHSAFMEFNGRFSPDGRLVVYYSLESGQLELYVQPFPGPGGKKQITTGGGSFVEWARDSRTLVYRDLERRLMAVPITLKGSVVEVGKPVAQEARSFGIVQSPDGQQVLQERIVKPSAPVTILLNWKPR